MRIDSWDTESSAAISLKHNWRFSVTISFTLAKLTLVDDVDSRPERGKSPTSSRPLLNALYHSYARVLDKVDSPWAFCNIFSDSAHETPFAMQNLRQILSSIFLSIGKIAKHTWDKLTASSTGRSCKPNALMVDDYQLAPRTTVHMNYYYMCTCLCAYMHR